MNETKNFGLSALVFEEMQSKLRAGDESLFEHIFLSQFQETVKELSKRLHIHPSKAHDVGMDTLLIFRKKLIEDKIKYGNLNFLFFQMGKQIFIQGLRKNKRTRKVEMLSAKKYAEGNEIDRETLIGLMNSVWDHLGEQCKKILEGFYYDNMNMKSLADMLNKSEVAIRKQKQRCIGHLKTRLSSIMYDYD